MVRAWRFEARLKRRQRSMDKGFISGDHKTFVPVRTVLAPSVKAMVDSLDLHEKQGTSLSRRSSTGPCGLTGAQAERSTKSPSTTLPAAARDLQLLLAATNENYAGWRTLPLQLPRAASLALRSLQTVPFICLGRRPSERTMPTLSPTPLLSRCAPMQHPSSRAAYSG